MFKRIFISAVLLLAVLSFIISLLGGQNGAEKVVPVTSKIAVIRIEGTIMSGEATEDIWGSQAATTGSIMAELREAARDESVKAVLLRINSPGGSVTAAEEIGREIARFKETTGKPVITSMGDTAASAGYWLAAYSDKIYANASTLTGSIGVYISYMNTEELYKKIGVQGDKIKSGAYKDILSNERPMTPEERALLQTMVDEMFAQFVQVVSTGRHMPEEQVRKLADGRVYTGKQALALGLVDEIGNYYDALDATAKLVGIQGTPAIKDFRKPKPWQVLFGSKLSDLVVGRLADELGERLGTSLPDTPQALR